MKVLYVLGPNLGRLGEREPHLYGSQTLAEIELEVTERATRLGHAVTWRQSDDETDVVAWIRGAAAEGFDAVIANPGALTHYASAVGEAAAACAVPLVEVHMTNIYAREPFRHASVVSPHAAAVIVGAGAGVYHLALEALPWTTR
ncbi:MAG: type II 3-dehydroquinate dehydratase [Actinomycetota bacterium]